MSPFSFVRSGKCRAIALVLGAVAAISSAAWAQVNFHATVTFGDSLTHNDILGQVYGNPQDMYGADPNEAVFNKGASSGDDLTNYAIAGSESQNVSIQIDFYEFSRLIGAQERATLIGFEIGGNDILNNIDLLKGSAPGSNPEADAVINNLISNIREDLLRLARTHRSGRLIIWDIPDVTLTPSLFNSLTPTEQANVRAHTGRVNQFIRRLDSLSDVVVFDLYALGRQMIADPPVLFGHQLVGPPAYGGYDHVFADEIHPTAVSNAFMANAMIQKINSEWHDTIPSYSAEELADLAHIPH